MNVFSGDIAKPTNEIVVHDDQSVLPDKENTASLNVEEHNTEFAVTLADLIKPDVPVQQNNILANTPIETDFSSERTAPVIDKDIPQANLSVQQQDDPKGFVADVKLDSQVAEAIQSTPNIIDTGQEVRQEKSSLVVSKPNVDVPVISGGLTKDVQPALAVIPRPKTGQPKTGQHQISGTVIVDIEAAPEKITPNKISTEATATLQPKQQNPNVPPTLLPTRNFADANANHGQITPQEFQPSPIGETNLRLQAPVHTQLPIQTTIITQIREPMAEHLNAAYEALQNRSTDKPKDIIVQLSPAELGRVQIRFSFDVGERVVAHIASENHETMAVLRQKSGLLLAQLKLGGFESIDLSFDATGQKSFSGQNSNTGFLNNQNGQNDTSFWQTAKADLERETPQSGIDNNVYPLRTHMHARSAQIDIIL